MGRRRGWREDMRVRTPVVWERIECGATPISVAKLLSIQTHRPRQKLDDPPLLPQDPTDVIPLRHPRFSLDTTAPLPSAMSLMSMPLVLVMLVVLALESYCATGQETRPAQLVDHESDRCQEDEENCPLPCPSSLGGLCSGGWEIDLTCHLEVSFAMILAGSLCQRITLG